MHLWNRWWHQGSLMLFRFWKMVWIFYRIVMFSIYDQRWFQQRLEGLQWADQWRNYMCGKHQFINLCRVGWHKHVDSSSTTMGSDPQVVRYLGVLIKYLLNQWHSHQPLLYVVISVAFKWSEHKLLYVGGKDLVFIRCIYLVPLVAGTDKLMVYYRLSSSCNIKVRNQLKQYYVGYKLYMQIPGFPDNISR